MTAPGFFAEASLYQTSRHYYAPVACDQTGGLPGLFPAQSFIIDEGAYLTERFKYYIPGPPTQLPPCRWCYIQGLACCNELCVDWTKDTNNCGGCGNVCPSGQSCQGGQCGCPGSQEYCGGSCVDTTSDPNNCGSCLHTCPANSTCQNGKCECNTGYCPKGNSCTSTNTSSDPNNCGYCEHTCSSGVCCNSSCLDSDQVCCGGGIPCGNESCCQDGKCLATKSVAGAPVCCPDGSTCYKGAPECCYQ